MVNEDDKDEIFLQKTSMRGLFYGFATSTGMHGLANIATSGGWIRKLLWTLLVLGAFGILIWQIYTAVVKLITYETATTTNTIHVSPIYFPAVTICNMNPVVFKELKKMNNTQANEMKTVLPSSAGDGPPTIGSVTGVTANDWSSLDKSNRRTDFTNSATFFRAMNEMNDTQFATLSVKINESLVDCSFEGMNCVPDDFTSFRDPRHGLCYTFNMPSDNSERKIVNESGISHALDVTLYVDQENYVPDIITTAGYRVLVHDPVTPPLPELHGYNVPPGFETAMSVHARVFSRETDPYGTCRNFTDDVNMNVNTLLNQLMNTKPTKEICMRTCTQKEIINTCHCYSYQFGFTRADAFKDLNNTARNTPCRTGETSPDYGCVQKVQREIAAGTRTCKTVMCKNEECISARYDVVQSSLLWPAEKAFSSLTDKVKAHPNRELVKHFQNVTPTAMRNFIYRNFVKLKVYFGDLEMTYIQTKRSYQWFDFIADFGGYSGLWLGFSILTFFELIELLANLFTVFQMKMKEKKVHDIRAKQRMEMDKTRNM